MEYPKRIDTHISESISFDALSSVLPDEWIIRELTERDYGVDLYIELVGKDGKVTGDLVALQVKSTKSIQFNNKGLFTYGGIKKSTINYWLGLPVPVFLIVVNLNNKGLFTYGGIKKSTINYWLGLPVPVFLIVVNLNNKHVYWSSVEINQREGRFNKNKNTASLILTSLHSEM